ncbi:hypothetical protein MMC08_005104 [Hypocenomyce scalaris]|nr:hypothetical protein [Hypocenomyce scalaris]
MSLIKCLTSALLLAGGTLAQYGSSSSSDGGYGDSGYGSDSASSAGSAVAAVVTSSATGSSPAPSGMVSVQVVKVSNKNGSLQYEPNNIQAEAGTMVQFQFYPKNHSVVQSTFDQPCQPINNIQSNVTGFFSGFMPVAEGAEMPTYTIMVNNTSPIWFYCSQAKHCQSGMVGVINAPAADQSRTIETFAALAKSVPANITPGETDTDETSGSTGSSRASAGTPTTIATVVGSAPTGPPSSGGSLTSSGTNSSVSSTAPAQAIANAASGSLFARGNEKLVAVGLGSYIVAVVAVMR